MIAFKKKRRSRHGKKSRRSHNPLFGRSRRHAKSRNRRHRRGRNPGVTTFKRPLGRLTAGFKPSVIMDAGIVAGGAFGNYWLRNQVSSRFIPQATEGIPSYILGLATAGAMLFVPKVGPKLFAGAVLEEVMRATSQYLLPGAKLLGDYLTQGSNDGLSDFLTSQEESAALGDYMEEGEQMDTSAINAAATFE